MPSRRELILLCLALITLLAGGYILYFDTDEVQTTARPDARTQEAKSFSSTASARLAKLKNNGPRKALQRILNEQWTHDPFIRIPNPQEQTDPATDAAVPAMEYTGFIEMGDVKIAIINGKEYEQGDVLETAGLQVQSISRQRVLIRVPSRKQPLTVPFSDIEQAENN